jgi:uncharacterized protein YdeI (BOF family)
MKRLMFATLAFTCLTTLVCLAQEAAKQDNTKEAAAQGNQKPATAIKTVTGCLQKGHEPWRVVDYGRRRKDLGCDQ